MWTVQVGYNEKEEAQGNEDVEVWGSPENRFHLKIRIFSKEPPALHRPHENETDDEQNVEP